MSAVVVVVVFPVADGYPGQFGRWPSQLLRCTLIQGHCCTAAPGIGAVLNGQLVQLGNQMLTGDAALDHSREAFAGVLVDD